MGLVRKELLWARPKPRFGWGEVRCLDLSWTAATVRLELGRENHHG
jgi:hypothetical protein